MSLLCLLLFQKPSRNALCKLLSLLKSKSEIAAFRNQVIVECLASRNPRYRVSSFLSNRVDLLSMGTQTEADQCKKTRCQKSS